MNKPEQYRKLHPLESLISEKGLQYYSIPHPEITSMFINCLASDGKEWQHVAVTVSKFKERPARCATWAEMVYVKDLFWDNQTAVMQLHPPESQYISNHPFALHLWHPVLVEIPLPPSCLVGKKELNGKF